MAIVLPQSILNNAWMGFVRDFILGNCNVNAVVSLPPQTFAPFKGVGKASVVFLTKKTKRDFGLNYPVFMAAARHVGYDNTSRPDKRDDLPGIAADYAEFQRGRRDFDSPSFVIDAEELKKGLAPEQFYGSAGPDGWERKSLDELCDGVIFHGSTPARSAYTESGIRILKVRDITNEGMDWDEGERAFAPLEYFRARSEARVQVGDILFTASAHHPRYIGEKIDIIDYIPEKYNDQVMCTAELMVLRVNPQRIDPFYVLLYLRSQQGYEAIQSCIRGQTAHIYPKDIRKILVPIPPEGELESLQQAILELKKSLHLRRQFKEAHQNASTDFSSFLARSQPLPQTMEEPVQETGRRRMARRSERTKTKKAAQ